MSAASDALHRAKQDKWFAWVHDVAQNYGNPKIEFNYRSWREREVWCTALFTRVQQAREMLHAFDDANDVAVYDNDIAVIRYRLQERSLPSGLPLLYFCINIPALDKLK